MSGSARLWLLAFVGTGIGLGVASELLNLHAGPARPSSFLVPSFGYLAQFVVGAILITLSNTWRLGQWTRPMVQYLILSSLASGAAQALDYVALVEGGYMLFTIFHSSVTFFACVLAVLVLRARVSAVQWTGCGLVVLGLVSTALPSPVVAKNSFAIGFAASAAGSLCLAAAYPLSELVFRSAPGTPPAEEMACFLGSVLNVGIYGFWTLAYTLPRWQPLVVEPILSSREPSVRLATAAYACHALLVGLHSLAFWKSLRRFGTVSLAVSKGAQQAGNFVVAHVLFCASDPTECLWNSGGAALWSWSRWQKPAAFVACCTGCLVYALGREARPSSKAVEACSDDEEEMARLAPLPIATTPAPQRYAAGR